MSFFGAGATFSSLGDDSAIDWGDVIDSGANAVSKIFTAKYAAQAAKAGASPYAVQSILGVQNQVGTGGLPPGYGYNAAGQLVNLATGQAYAGGVAGVAGNVGSSVGSIFDNIARSVGIQTSTLFIVLAIAGGLYLLPSPRGRR